MAQPRIVIQILDGTHGHSIGAEIQAILEREPRYQVYLSEEPLADRTPGAHPRPDLIIPFLPASKDSAVKLLATLREKDHDTPLLPVLRSEGLNEMLDELSRRTQDFLVTPFRETEVLARVRRLVSWNKQPGWNKSNEPVIQTVGLARLIGEDPIFVAMKRKLPLMARHEAPVLLTGETGTGKELCARALHYLSPRSGKPFLPVNCGAVPVELFESELFGHQKGAFTGAWVAQPGLIEEAEEGTLFLDEIESLSLGAQVKLLRFLEDHTYHSLGSAKTRQADVWIIAATNVEIKEKIRQGTFREDLFHRLAVMNLSLPPLRHRRADIPLLVAHFWSRHGERQDGGERRLSPRAMEALCQYAWPGNVRELENVIQQILVLTDAEIIEPQDLQIPRLDEALQPSINDDPVSKREDPPIPLGVSLKAPPGLSFNQAKARLVAQFEKSYVIELLRANGGNVTRAAKVAHKERRSFGRLVKKYQLEKS